MSNGNDFPSGTRARTFEAELEDKERQGDETVRALALEIFEGVRQGTMKIDDLISLRPPPPVMKHLLGLLMSEVESPTAKPSPAAARPASAVTGHSARGSRPSERATKPAAARAVAERSVSTKSNGKARADGGEPIIVSSTASAGATAGTAAGHVWNFAGRTLGRAFTFARFLSKKKKSPLEPEKSWRKRRRPYVSPTTGALTRGAVFTVTATVLAMIAFHLIGL